MGFAHRHSVSQFGFVTTVVVGESLVGARSMRHKTGKQTRWGASSRFLGDRVYGKGPRLEGLKRRAACWGGGSRVGTCRHLLGFHFKMLVTLNRTFPSPCTSALIHVSPSIDPLFSAPIFRRILYSSFATFFTSSEYDPLIKGRMSLFDQQFVRSRINTALRVQSVCVIPPACHG